MSETLSSDGTYFVLMVSCSAKSFTKLYLISICFGYFGFIGSAQSSEGQLSPSKVVALGILQLKSLNIFRNHRTSLHVSLIATYSASAVESAVHVCFREKNWRHV